jgi:hypothetical protein
MLYILRYNIKEGKNARFHRWILNNAEAIAAGDSGGWHYLGTYFTVRALGQFDAETHWELDDYGALGAGFGDEAMQRMLGEWIAFIDGQVQACLLKSAEDVEVLAGS